MSIIRTATRLLLAAAAMVTGVDLAQAQRPFPTKPIVIVVPAPRGGGTDTFARELAKIVEDDLQQAVIIDNRPRGGGTDGVARTVAAQPDGYTLAFVWNSPLTARPLAEPVTYTQRSYQAVMSVGFSSYVLCTRPDFPAQNAQQFLERLRERPNAFTVGNDGLGGTMHLASERIFQRIGAQVRAVPFVGSTDTARNLLAGRIDVYGGSLSSILPHVRDGAAKCLLLTSAANNAAVPRAGGLESVGLADTETVLWWGLIAPAGVPAATIARLEQAFTAAAETERFRALMARQGATVKLRGSAATSQLIQSEAEALRRVAETLGITRPLAGR